MEGNRGGNRRASGTAPKFLYQTFRIGASKISGVQINIPAQVMKNFALTNGDMLEWYPCSTDFPDDKEKEVIAMLIVRSKEKEKHG